MPADGILTALSSWWCRHAPFGSLSRIQRGAATCGYTAYALAGNVRPYSKWQKNDFRDAEAIAEAVQRPTMKFVATKTADQLDVQALQRVRERLVRRTGK